MLYCSKVIAPDVLVLHRKNYKLMLGNSTFPLSDYITLNRRSGQCIVLFRNSETIGKFREKIFSSTWSSYSIGSEKSLGIIYRKN